MDAFEFGQMVKQAVGPLEAVNNFAAKHVGLAMPNRAELGHAYGAAAGRAGQMAQQVMQGAQQFGKDYMHYGQTNPVWQAARGTGRFIDAATDPKNSASPLTSGYRAAMGGAASAPAPAPTQAPGQPSVHEQVQQAAGWADKNLVQPVAQPLQQGLARMQKTLWPQH